MDDKYDSIFALQNLHLYGPPPPPPPPPPTELFSEISMPPLNHPFPGPVTGTMGESSRGSSAFPTPTSTSSATSAAEADEMTAKSATKLMTEAVTTRQVAEEGAMPVGVASRMGENTGLPRRIVRVEGGERDGVDLLYRMNDGSKGSEDDSEEEVNGKEFYMSTKKERYAAGKATSGKRGYYTASDDSNSARYSDQPVPAYKNRMFQKSISRHHLITPSQSEEWQQEVLASQKNRLAMLALSTHVPSAILKKPSTMIADTKATFNVKIPLEGSPVTNQRRSGRCWLFASTNVFRVAYMKMYNLADFELSQAYLFFWDKLEKANFFLESMLDTHHLPLHGRLLTSLMASPVGDGGQWDMVANLVEKYGLVPQKLYPDSENARNSSNMDRLLTTKLRSAGLTLRSLAESGKSKPYVLHTKEEMMQDIHRMLVLMLGPPPSPDEIFTWTFYDKDGKFRSVQHSPITFAQELSAPVTVQACNGTDYNTLFSLVNDPRNSYWQQLSVERLGNVYEGRPVRYVNVPMSTMKSISITMLMNGIPVFFGCDVGKSPESGRGIMDLDLYDVELGFGVKMDMSKSERLYARESQMTHAMVLTGVHIGPDGKPERWRVQNSWSEAAGDDGFFVMSDRWMDEFVYQVVVSPYFVSKDVRDILDKEPKMLPLWDPMGALA